MSITAMQASLPGNPSITHLPRLILNMPLKSGWTPRRDKETKAMFVEGMLEVAREKLVKIGDDAKLIEAAKLLSSGTDLVIVCDSRGALQGVVTKTDVVRQISVCQGATCMCPVSTVMTRDVALCQEADLLQDVSKLIKERHLKNIPVVDGDNRPVGVLTARAVLRVLLSDAEYEEAQLVDYVKGIGYR